MKNLLLMVVAMAVLLAACKPVNVEAPVPVYETGIDPEIWVTIPAGAFLAGQFNESKNIEYDFEMTLTDITTSQYAGYLNDALASGKIRLEGEQIVGFYPGDPFREGRHEEKIDPGDYLYIPLGDPALRLSLDGNTFTVKAGFENHPMTMVSWFGAWGYCGFYDARLPKEVEWEKAARGKDGRPFPWGEDRAENIANYYHSRDPFEDMQSLGSRTSPVGFYNGGEYDGYVTLNSASPYGLYDMAGNVWQWMGDVYEQQHYRYLRGGSKDTNLNDLRVWVRNNATPEYYSPGVGFRCVRDKE